MNILQEIALATQARITAQKMVLPEAALELEALSLPRCSEHPFERALVGQDMAFICEIKRASPSKGDIVDDFDYIKIAKEYEAAGANAISILTEPNYFRGCDCYLREIALQTTLPLLRKDFVIDSYMILQSKVLGASAILLICSLLTKAKLKEFIAMADGLGLSTLVEVHNEREVDMALEVGARIIGINNRNLEDFTVDLSISERLCKQIPSSAIVVSESGISSADEVARLHRLGIAAVLVGESLMRCEDKIAALAMLRGG